MVDIVVGTPEVISRWLVDNNFTTVPLHPDNKQQLMMTTLEHLQRVAPEDVIKLVLNEENAGLYLSVSCFTVEAEKFDA